VELRFLYIGSSDTEQDVVAWLTLPGAVLRWRFSAFGADVAAVDLGSAPLLLIADHRPPGSVLPIYAVADLDEASAALEAGGWTPSAPMGTPEGPALVMTDSLETELALLRVDRPGAMDDAYLDQSNPRARRAP
jgi:hypothetical protein